MHYFKDSTTFKSALFYDKISCNNRKFEEDLNLKYIQISRSFNITNINITYEIASKYTKINRKALTNI
jgi:hypothetical protein